MCFKVNLLDIGHLKLEKMVARNKIQLLELSCHRIEASDLASYNYIGDSALNDTRVLDMIFGPIDHMGLGLFVLCVYWGSMFMKS